MFGALPATSSVEVGQIQTEVPATQKESLISSMKATKKANVAAAPAKNEGVSIRKNAVRYGKAGVTGRS